MSTLTISEIEYLALEGGGGKGAAYLGAIEVLEDWGLLPIKQPAGWSYGDKGKHQIKGVSGSSAGAITALVLAMGLSSSDIKRILDRVIIDESSGVAIKDRSLADVVSGQEGLILGDSIFETFFDYPIYNLNGSQRTLNPNGKNYYPQRVVKKVSSDQFIACYQNFCSYRRVTIGAIYANIIKYGVSEELLEADPVLKKIFTYQYNRSASEGVNLRKSWYFIENLLYFKGLFNGIGVRKFMESLIKEYLIDRHSPQNDGNNILIASDHRPSSITFRDFYYLTGVNLILTGTNITKAKPYYFSKDSTPHFPVTEAVAISMNIPVLYKPIKIINDEKLEGEWVDGGMLNNTPIHAFDYLQGLPYSSSGLHVNEHLDPNHPKNTSLNPAVLGLRLEDGYPPGVINNESSEIVGLSESPMLSNEECLESLEFSQESSDEECFENFQLPPLLGDLLSTLMYPTELGQIRTKQEEDQTLKLYACKLSTTNFAPSVEDREEAIEHSRNLMADYLTKFLEGLD